MKQVIYLLASSHKVAADYAENEGIDFWQYIHDQKGIYGKTFDSYNFRIVDYDNLDTIKMQLLNLVKTRMRR